MSRLHADDGATAVEYGLIVASIAALVLLVLFVLGQQAQTQFCDASSAMEQVGAPANPNC